jgi:soluble lytic murein transglycosylase
MRARARFVLAFEAAASDLVRAEQALAIAEREGDEDAEDVQGRAAYWRARVLEKLTRRREAADVYERLARGAPLTYYGQQAFARLRALDPGRARALLAHLREPPPPTLTFELRPELSDPAVFRAVALLRVGESALALSELRAAGVLSEAADLELFLAGVALLDRAGASELAVELVRKRMPELLMRAPVGRDRLLFELAYPRAFAPMIEDVGKRARVPPAFLRAVAREESGFHPAAVSRAGARGLIQLLPSTAKAIAKSLGVRHGRSALSDPEVNLALGAQFIANLERQMRGQWALVPSAYNAGPGITGRWLEERRDQPLDQWIEDIPYDETRHYTRRVIQSYGVYTFLETGQLLELPSELPAL